jgi:predicted DNA-binding transcriptional regulator AlpA
MTAAETRLLTGEAAAAQLGTSQGSLARWRREGVGPNYLKLRGKVFYRQEDLSAWIAKNTVRPC